MSNKSIYSNIAALMMVQFSNYIAPLLVLPYLSRALGVDGFGIIMFSMSLCGLALIITDYGFGLSGAYWISKNKENKGKVSQYIGAVFLIKVILVALLLLLLMLCCFLFDGGGATYPMLPFISIVVLSQSFLSIWFFQGIEKMKAVTIFMVTSKLLYLGFVFLFIKEKGDEPLVLVCMAVSNFIATLMCIISIYREGYKISRPSKHDITEAFKQSSEFFLSRAAVGIYTTASTFIVGVVAGVQQAALYSSAEKLYQAGQSLTSPVSQALYPYLARTGDKNILYKFVLSLSVPMLIGILGCIYFSSDILSFIYGPGFSDAANVLSIFLICSMVTFISINFGYPAFAAIGKVSLANKTVFIGGGVQLLSLFTLYISDNITALNVVLSVLLTEFIVLVTRIYLYMKFKY